MQFVIKLVVFTALTLCFRLSTSFSPKFSRKVSFTIPRMSASATTGNFPTGQKKEGHRRRHNPNKDGAFKKPKIGSTENLKSLHVAGGSAVAMDVDEEGDGVVESKPSSASASAPGGSNLFSSLAISENTKRAINEVMKYSTMTPVQQAAIPVVLQGQDIVVKAKTGTGKTVAFLVPAIDILIKERVHHRKNSRTLSRDGQTVSVPALPRPIILVLSPTRELALQIADEARSLCTFHGFNVVTLVGGTNAESDKRALSKPDFVDIVVGTPGRVLMHLEETKIFTDMCAQTKVLVFDEADRLLDMGFKRDIDKIMSYLRPSKAALAAAANSDVKLIVRQTLLFSATFSDEVRGVAGETLRKGYNVVDTVGEEVEQTHSHVPQSIIVTPLEDQISTLATLIAQQRLLPEHKVIVFFPTARHTGYMAELFNAAGTPVLEIHSRKSQGARTRASEDFRNSRSAILFSSDVTARGMDYPDVTLVIQVGLTSREQYIHRLGRTARAGKGGDGVILCFSAEEPVLRSELSDMPLNTTNAVAFGTHVNGTSAQPEDLAGKIRRIVQAGPQGDMRESAQQAWAAWLGFYNGYQKKMRWVPKELVAVSKSFAHTLGLEELPGLQKKTLHKMGLFGVEGLKVDNEPYGGGGRSGQQKQGQGQSRPNSGSAQSGRSSQPPPSQQPPKQSQPQQQQQQQQQPRQQQSAPKSQQQSQPQSQQQPRQPQQQQQQQQQSQQGAPRPPRPPQSQQPQSNGRVVQSAGGPQQHQRQQQQPQRRREGGGGGDLSKPLQSQR